MKYWNCEIFPNLSFKTVMTMLFWSSHNSSLIKPMIKCKLTSENKEILEIVNSNSKSRNAGIFVHEQLNTDNLYPFKNTNSNSHYNISSYNLCTKNSSLLVFCFFHLNCNLNSHGIFIWKIRIYKKRVGR